MMITYCVCFLFLCVPRSLWNPVSPTRDQTWVPEAKVKKGLHLCVLFANVFQVPKTVSGT